MTETIETAAIMADDGAMVTLPRPARHHTIIHHLAAKGHGPIGPAAQGFATSTGRFVDRVEGLRIAQAAGQIIEKHPDFEKLYSEDMW